MKVFIVGATGFIGRNLVKELLNNNHQVVALTRNFAKGKSVLGSEVEIIEGNPMHQGAWQNNVDGCDAVIVMCGEPIVDKKWTAERKQLLIDSRLIPTRNVTEAISKSKNKPSTLLCGSAIGFYGNRDSEIVTESTKKGTDFAAQLCSSWEDEASKAKDLGVRVVSLRTGFVLAKDGGALSKMLAPYKFFMGGAMGSGKQYLSWIHIIDYVGIALKALEDNSIEGPLNMTSPNPVTNKEFATAIGISMSRPSFFKAPAFVLKLILGESSSLILEGQRVIPQKAIDSKYKFQFEKAQDALDDILA